MPSNNLSYVVKDHRGYLWISTFDGAARFDGNEFRIFDTKNIPQLSTSAFHSILSLKDSSIIFSTQSSGLLFYKKGVFSSPYENSILPKNIMMSYMDSEGKLWVGSGASGLYCIKDRNVEKYDIPEFDNIRIAGIIQSSDGNMWVISEGEGVALITKEGYQIFTNKTGLLSNIVHAAFEFNGKIYFGTSHGLSIYENGSWVEDDRLAGLTIFTIVSDNNNNLWFGTVLGLGRLNNADEFEFISVENGLPERAINGIEIDNYDNIWLAIYRGGLVRLKPSKVKNISMEDGLSYHNINIITEAPNGQLYAGNNEGGIDIIENGDIKNILKKRLYKNTPIKDFLIEDDGTVWVATYKGVIKITSKGEQIFTKKSGLLSDKIRCLIKSDDGSIWVGSRNGGINIIAEDSSIKSIAKKDGLSSDFIFSLDHGFDGDILASTSNGGLNIIHPNLEVEVINPENVFDDIIIFNIYVENANTIWMATNVGLYYYNNDAVFLINHENGLPAETVFDVLEDDFGNLWMTSVKGVIRINKSEALAFIEGKTDKVNTLIFDESDGMITRECTGATKLLLASNGLLWIPTIKGISIFDLKNLSISNTEAPSVYIENVIIDDEPLDKYSGGNISDKIRIEPGHISYHFSYTSLTSANSKTIFRHKLEGFDKDWTNVGTERLAKYTNIPYGDYTLKVMATDNTGLWSGEAAELDIVIVPYFYETKAFFILVLFVFITLIYLVYKYQTNAVIYRNRELLKLNAELDSFTYSVSHDLKAPLTSIQGLINVARIDNTKDSSFYYDKIESSVGKLDNFIKDIIDYSKNSRMEVKKESLNVKQLISGLMEGLAYMNKEKEVKHTIDIPSHLNIVTDKTRLTFIINNLLTNAFRYADLSKESPFVKISAEIKESSFVLSIKDNGQGIRKELQGKIFDMFVRANESSGGSGLGLYIVKESVNKLSGTIELESEINIGTRIVVKIPIGSSSEL